MNVCSSIFRPRRSMSIPRRIYERRACTVPASVSSALYQPVPDRRFGQNMPGLRGIFLQLLPQVSHVYPHIVAVLGVRRPPDFAQDLTMREHLAGIGDQQGQQTVFNRSQVYRLPTFVDGAQAQIDLDVAELENGAESRAGIPAPARSGAHPRQQFSDAERFGQIVVRAGVQGLDLILLADPGRQYDHGYTRPSAQIAQQFHAVAVGHAKVQNDEIWFAGARVDQTLPQGIGLVHAPTLRLQGRAYETA